MKMQNDRKYRPVLDRLSRPFASISRSSLAWAGLALAAVVLLSVNLVSSISLRDWQADMTEDQLFTISEGTREVLREIDEPIRVRLYFSKRLGEESSSYARYFNRVQNLLESFKDISGGKLEVSYLDPEPFSPEEDRAVAAGLRKVTFNAGGEVGYFGLTAINSTDKQETIDFFHPERQTFLEYDVTKLIHSLANPKKTVVGVVSGLPIAGERDPRTGRGTPPWLIMRQMGELFDVHMLEQNLDKIPADVDVLLVAQPNELTPDAAYAIDQYMLGGGRALVLVDPVSEVTQFGNIGESREGLDELAKVLKAWGIEFDRKTVVADIAHAQRVRFGQMGDTVTDYVAWLGLDSRNLEQNDVLSAGIETLNLATSGALKSIDGAEVTVTPIIKTSDQAMTVAKTDVGVRADPVELLRNYQPGGKPLVLAARVSGKARSAFPEGPPDEEKTADAGANEAKPESDTEAASKDAQHFKSGDVNAIVIADTDLMADRFWVEQSEMFGQRIAVPTAQNAALVIGALENLSGSDALIALRGRGVRERTFTLVEDLRRDAERRFRQEEEELTKRLAELQSELAKLESGDGAVILTDTNQETAEKSRAEMLKTRRELRDVKLALRHDIDRLDGWLKFANIALVPLAIGVGGLGWTMWRARKTGGRSHKAKPEDRS